MIAAYVGSQSDSSGVTLHRMVDSLDDPAGRERLLAGLDPDGVREHHELLRAIFRAEVRHLTEQGHADVARELSAYPELKDDLQEWEAFRRTYFFPAAK